MKLDYNESTYGTPFGDLHHSSIKVEHVKELLGNEPRCIMIVGSWDGGDEYRFQRAYPYAKVYGVEASFTAFHRAEKVSRSGPKIFNCAMASYDGFIPFYGSDNHNGEWCSGSVLKHTEDFIKDTGVSSRAPITVPCKRLDTLCSEEKIRDIDYLQLDTEGYVADIVSGFGDIRPKVIMAEILPQRWYNGGDSVDVVSSKLALLGYECVDNNGVDWLYVRRK